MPKHNSRNSPPTCFFEFCIHLEQIIKSRSCETGFTSQPSTVNQSSNGERFVEKYFGLESVRRREREQKRRPKKEKDTRRLSLSLGNTWPGLINRFQVSPAPPRGRLSPVILTTFNQSRPEKIYIRDGKLAPRATLSPGAGCLICIKTCQAWGRHANQLYF